MGALAAIFEFLAISRTVLDVVLNFAAVAFVVTLDKAAFQLSSLGFLGEQSEKISGTWF
jgi:hypothetical protein